MSAKSSCFFDIAVVGGGLAGMTAALTLARQLKSTKEKIALFAPVSPVADGRTTALLGKSVDHLEDLGVWQPALPHAAALSTMRILDGTNRLWRAPPVEFRAMELGFDAFGYNIANIDLGNIMREHIANEPSITVFNDIIVSAEPGETDAVLEGKTTGTITTKLVIAADGKKSAMRDFAGISVKSWAYPQIAIAVNLTHTVSHNFTSTEFHTEEGPFTVVPMPDLNGKYQSGLVWIMRPEKIDPFLRLPRETIEKTIEDKMQSMLGEISLASKPQQFPMSGMIARKFAANRIALVGDAAHLFPPIGAQGFNLGLRDVVEICDLASQAVMRGQDPGSKTVQSAFERKRRIDVSTRTGAVDMLNRSLLSDFLPVQAARGLGLFALAHVPALRKFMMSQGMAAKRKAGAA